MATESKEGAAATPEKKKRPWKAIVLIAVVMLAEGGAVFFATTWIGGGPVSVEGVTPGADAEAPPEDDDAEIRIAELMAPNRKTGRVMVYEITIAGRVNKAKAEALTELVKEKRLLIDDRLSNIIRAADPRILAEDGLEALKRQIRFEINKILNDENAVKELLIPKLMPHRAD